MSDPTLATRSKGLARGGCRRDRRERWLRRGQPDPDAQAEQLLRDPRHAGYGRRVLRDRRRRASGYCPHHRAVTQTIPPRRSRGPITCWTAGRTRARWRPPGSPDGTRTTVTSRSRTPTTTPPLRRRPTSNQADDADGTVFDTVAAYGYGWSPSQAGTSTEDLRRRRARRDG